MNTLMQFSTTLVEQLKDEEMILVRGGDKVPEASPNNGSGLCDGSNNSNGRCLGPNNSSGRCGN